MGLSASEKTVKRTDQRGRVTLVTMAEAINKLKFHYSKNTDIAESLANGNRLQTDFACYELTDCNSN